jgi:anti-sigma factor RsiW
MSVLMHLATPTCRESHRLLPGYVDGEVGPLARRRVRRHLAQCPACSQMLERLTRGLRALRALSTSESSDDGSVAAAVLECIRRDHPDPGDPS